MNKIRSMTAVLAAALLLLAQTGPALFAVEKVKSDQGYNVKLSSSTIELEFPDGSVLSTPLNFDGKSLDKITANGGMAQKLLDEAYQQLGVEKNASLPKAFSLAQNSPNPFNPSTTISYAIPESSIEVAVKLSVFNIRGQVVKTLVNESQAPGAYLVGWDGTSDTGQRVASGVYFYRLEAGGFISTRKMVVLK